MRLYEILEARSNVPVDDAFAVLFAGKHKTSEISGVPPVSFTSKGGVLEDYRIYGNTSGSDGCGERTSQLFNKDNFIDGGNFAPNASRRVMVASANAEILLIPCKANTTYTVSRATMITHVFAMVFVTTDQITDGLPFAGGARDGLVLSSTSADDSRFLCIYYAKKAGSGGSTPEEIRQQLSEIMVNEGPTALPYEPYGYKIPLTISNGSAAETTPVYIGNDQLMQGEYVSFAEQKIYRYVNGVLTPTDPPVPLPAIRTLTGTNILTVGTAVQPSSVTIRGRIRPTL